jgi:hypothetical protein
MEGHSAKACMRRCDRGRGPRIGWDGVSRQGHDGDRAKERRRSHAWPAGDLPGRAPGRSQIAARSSCSRPRDRRMRRHLRSIRRSVQLAEGLASPRRRSVVGRARKPVFLLRASVWSAGASGLTAEDARIEGSSEMVPDEDQSSHRAGRRVDPGSPGRGPARGSWLRTPPRAGLDPGHDPGPHRLGQLRPRHGEPREFDRQR